MMDEKTTGANGGCTPHRLHPAYWLCFDTRGPWPGGHATPGGPAVPRNVAPVGTLRAFQNRRGKMFANTETMTLI